MGFLLNAWACTKVLTSGYWLMASLSLKGIEAKNMSISGKYYSIPMAHTVTTTTIIIHCIVLLM